MVPSLHEPTDTLPLESPRSLPARPVPSDGRRWINVCSNVGIGGTPVFALTFTNALRRRGWDSAAWFPRVTGWTQTDTWARSQGIPTAFDRTVRPLGKTPNPLTRIRQTLRLARELRAAAPDVVDFHYGGNHAAASDALAHRLARTQARLVATIHHPAPWSAENRRDARSSRLFHRLGGTVLASSDATRRILEQGGLPVSALRTCLLGVPLPVERDRRAARARWGIPDDAVVIVTVARLVEDKGIAHVIRAFQRALQDEGAASPHRLLIASDGPERERLERLARDTALPADAIRFLGYVDDPVDLFFAGDIHAMPSEREGFGLSYVEAAFAGLPSIAGSVGAGPEVVEDGRTGWVVDFGDEDALTRVLVEGVRDRERTRRLGVAARERCRREFTIDAAVERTLGALELA